MHDAAERLRVIIVEPELGIATSVKDILDISGFEAKALTDPVQGLRAVLSESPIVVIAAVVMAQVNGVELAIQAKRNFPGCTVLLWSAMPEAADLMEEALAREYSFEILPKPIQPTVLLDKIREAGRETAVKVPKRRVRALVCDTGVSKGLADDSHPRHRFEMPGPSLRSRDSVIEIGAPRI